MKTQSVIALLLSGVGAVVVSSTAACSSPACDKGETVHYSPAQDDVAVASMQTSWSGTLSDGRAFTISVCEDVGNDTVPAAGTCGEAAVHVIRGGDQGKDESFTQPGSCGIGGCYDGVAMNAKGTLVLGGVSTPMIGVVASSFAAPYDSKQWTATLSDAAGTTTISIPYNPDYATLVQVELPTNDAGADARANAAAASGGDGQDVTVTDFKNTGAAQCQ